MSEEYKTKGNELASLSRKELEILMRKTLNGVYQEDDLAVLKISFAEGEELATAMGNLKTFIDDVLTAWYSQETPF